MILHKGVRYEERGPAVSEKSKRTRTARMIRTLQMLVYRVEISGNPARECFQPCELTIFGLGSHSATGEEWTDDENAGTSAEAQAFKRACACFGLGRYLYYFDGAWVDLDERKRPKIALKLFGWATPEGWRRGLRPQLMAELTQTAQPPALLIPAAARTNNSL